MIGVVVAAHGTLAEALVTTAEGIVGALPGTRVVNLLPGEGLDAARGKIREAVRAVEQGDGVIVLADLFGGTPCNTCLSLLEEGRIEVVSGVNLPMLLKLASLRDGDVHEAAEELVTYGQRNVTLASDAVRARCGQQAAAGSASSRSGA